MKDIQSSTRPIGEYLIAKNLITNSVLTDALERQKKIGERIGKILVCSGHIQLLQLEEVLSEQFQLPFCHLNWSDFDAKILDHTRLKEYLELRYLPINNNSKNIKVAMADPSTEQIKKIQSLYRDKKVDFCIIFSSDFYKHYHFLFRLDLNEHAVNALRLTTPEFSAQTTLTKSQKVLISLIFFIFIYFLRISSLKTLIALNALITFFLITNFIFKFILIWFGTRPKTDNKISITDIENLSIAELPIYSIIIPLYKESETASQLIDSLKKIDYPREKLDVKIVLEEDDQETIAFFKRTKDASLFDIIIVPHSFPKTKPKACNYALQFVKGKYVTIYDAEDRPDPLQLKKAIACFRKSDHKTACVQARLNFFNSDENWLAKMFTLEYSMWFDFFLPALEELKVPIPLGGTSNHFKVEILRNIGGWDPFNVTEDADLGIRFSKLDLKVEIINSTTYEEANIDVLNWIKQRSRWQKGYMQTYLVHMRSPLRFLQKTRLKGFLSFQLFIGSTFISALIIPWMYFIFLFLVFNKESQLHFYFPPIILAIAAVNLLFGNFYFIYIQMFGVFKRKNFKLIPFALLTPFYWLLMSVAAYRGLFQLISNPFYWDKTKHGLTKMSKKERKE